MNIPINRYQSKLLPLGYTPTSDGFNRKKRRSKEFKRILQKMTQEGNSIELEKQLIEETFS